VLVCEQRQSESALKASVHGQVRNIIALRAAKDAGQRGRPGSMWPGWD